MCILYLLSNLLLSFIPSGFLSIYGYRIYQSSRTELREPPTTARNELQLHVANAD